MDYVGYHTYLSEELPPESPYLYGLHPNAEIGFLTMTSEHLFRTVLEMQPRDGAGGSGSGMSKEEKVSIHPRYTYYICTNLHSKSLGEIMCNHLFPCFEYYTFNLIGERNVRRNNGANA